MSLALGLISGTSADGTDAALLEVDESPNGPTVRLRLHRTVRHPDGLRRRILDATRRATPAGLTDLHTELGEAFGAAALALLAEAGVDPSEVEVVGSHGQTIWHRPPAEDGRGATLQLGDPATIAAVTGIAVASDFRAADMAAGGHGAPLVPWPDRVLFSAPGRSRVVLNVGGMANLTRLPPRGVDEPPVAFDTGPGNVLLDAAAVLASGGTARCDLDGTLARAGRIDDALLARLLADPFFDERPPRSTGRERFGPSLVEGLAEERGLVAGDPSGWPDLLATLVELTARSVTDALTRWVRPREIGEVVVTGGGAHNPALMDALANALDPVPVRSGPDVLGALSDAREAAAFALLAWAHLRGIPGNVPSVTGASGPRVLGSLTPAPGRTP